jgi:hypothetical protein
MRRYFDHAITFEVGGRVSFGWQTFQRCDRTRTLMGGVQRSDRTRAKCGLVHSQSGRHRAILYTGSLALNLYSSTFPLSWEDEWGGIGSEASRAAEAGVGVLSREGWTGIEGDDRNSGWDVAIGLWDADAIYWLVYP